MYDVMQSNNKLEQTSWKQHYLLINLCLKMNATGNSGAHFLIRSAQLVRGNALRIGPAHDTAALQAMGHERMD